MFVCRVVVSGLLRLVSVCCCWMGWCVLRVWGAGDVVGVLECVLVASLFERVCVLCLFEMGEVYVWRTSARGDQHSVRRGGEVARWRGRER